MVKAYVQDRRHNILFPIDGFLHASRAAEILPKDPGIFLATHKSQFFMVKTKTTRSLIANTPFLDGLIRMRLESLINNAENIIHDPNVRSIVIHASEDQCGIRFWISGFKHDMTLASSMDEPPLPHHAKDHVQMHYPVIEIFRMPHLTHHDIIQEEENP